MEALPNSPYGYDIYTHVEAIPKPPPVYYRWTIGPVVVKQTQPPTGNPGSPATGNESVQMQLTADQQSALSITGQDRYGNPVNITGNTTWRSSDESIVSLTDVQPDSATAVAVGPVGSAAVTVTNDVENDGTGDFIGSISFDVVAGVMADIEVTAAEPTDKPQGR